MIVQMPEHFVRVSASGTAGSVLTAALTRTRLLAVAGHAGTISAAVHTIIIHTIPFFEIASILVYENE